MDTFVYTNLISDMKVLVSIFIPLNFHFKNRDFTSVYKGTRLMELLVRNEVLECRRKKMDLHLPKVKVWT